MDFLLLHQVLICGTHVLLQLCQFWTRLRGELAHKSPYQVSVEGLKLRLSELKAKDHEARMVRDQSLKDDLKKNADGILCH